METREAITFGEWCLLVNDLQHSLQAAKLWKEASNEKNKNVNNDTLSSCFRDAVISFIACFDTAAPVRLSPDEIYHELSGGMEYYRWLSTLRNTWIAHRHGTSRQAVAGIVVDETTGDYLGIGHLIQSYQCPKRESADDLIKFISMAIIHAESKKKEMELKVVEQAKSMKPSQRLRLSVATTKVPNSKTLHIGRKKFRNINRDNK